MTQNRFAAAMNFPWAGRNPGLFTLAVGLFATAMFSPLALLAGRAHPALLVLPLEIGAAFALTFRLTSFGMRRSVARLHAAADADAAGRPATLKADATIVVGILRTPGVVRIEGDTLVLRPVLGRERRVPLGSVRGVREVTTFNGRVLFGTARGFWLTVADPPAWRLGLAVQDADAWRAALVTHTN